MLPQVFKIIRNQLNKKKFCQGTGVYAYFGIKKHLKDDELISNFKNIIFNVLQLFLRSVKTIL